LLLHFQCSPLPWIVTAFDIVEDIRSRLSSGPELLPVRSFPPKHAEEALRGGIVSTTPHGTHASSNVVGRQGSVVAIRPTKQKLIIEYERDGFVVTAFMTSKTDKLVKRGIQWRKS
jgi:hypothetical protein